MSMFTFENINNLLEGKLDMEELKVEKLTDEHYSDVLTSARKLGAGDRLIEIINTLIGDWGIVKDRYGVEDCVNAICVFEGKVKGIGAMMDDPVFTLYELDCHELKLHLTDTLIGGIINRDRNIDAYNKTRRFNKDRISCIIPVNEAGWREYASSDVFITKLTNPDSLTHEGKPAIDDSPNKEHNAYNPKHHIIPDELDIVSHHPPLVYEPGA